jgi:hypothetical protein
MGGAFGTCGRKEMHNTGFWYQNLQEIIVWKTWTQVGGYLIRSLGNRVRGHAMGFFSGSG